MAQIIGFNLSKEDYLNLAETAFKNGETEKSITYLDKALAIDERFVEASLALAGVYASLGAWEISNATLYKALAKHPCADDRDRIFYQLAMNFLDVNLPDVAEYYLRDIADAYDLQLPEDMGSMSGEPQDEGFRVVYPKGEDYYEMLISKAYELVRERKLDEAIALMDEIDPRSKSKAAANHIVLVCLMMKNDIDSVIANAQKMLAEDGDNLAVKCTLATAFLMENKMAEAYAVLDQILEKDYTNMEEILMILPILVNMEMHAQVVKYTRRVLEKLDLQPNTMIWLSQALYNLDQKEEARKVMLKVRTIFGEYSPADYFLQLYKQNPDKVAYSMNLPYVEKIARYKDLDKFLKMSPFELQLVIFDHDEQSAHMKKLIEWAFTDDNENLKLLLVDKLALVNSQWVSDFLRRQLISTDLSFDLMSRLLFCLVQENTVRFKFDVVAQDRFKSIDMVFPNAFHKLGGILHGAVAYCVSDIVFTDEEPNMYLATLTNIVNSIVTLDESGKLKYSKPAYKKIANMRSVRTLIGVLLCKVYEDDADDMREQTIERYNLNEKTFDKYYKMIFGEDDARE
ncbi:MAG TPA: hypothetical protein DD626_05740 [Clostridiales bacterium]|mgnify:FL=1|nr:hypothetical protein [Clostridiales bacterium]